MGDLAITSLTPGLVSWQAAGRLFALRGKAKNLSPRTLESYADTVGAFQAFTEANGADKPAGVTPHHVRAYLEALRAKGNSSASVETRYGHLQTFYKWLVRDGLAQADPVSQVDRPRRMEKVVRPFTAEELRLVLAQLDPKDPLDVRDRALILFLADSGARLSEALGLRLADIDLAASIATVQGKGGKERRITWGETTRRAVLGWLKLRPEAREADPVFCDRFGQPLKKDHAGHRIKALTKKAGIASPRLSAHALRHMAACELLRGGADVETVRRILGHARLSVTQRYLAGVTEEAALLKARAVGVVDRLVPVIPGERRQVRIK